MTSTQQEPELELETRRSGRASRFSQMVGERVSQRARISEGGLRRMNTEEQIEVALAESEEFADQEREVENLERRQLHRALTESKKLQYMGPAERARMAAAEVAEAESHEPPLLLPEDVELWTRWAEKQAERHVRMTHPRVYGADGLPTAQPLPLWSTTRREIGRQYGAGVELYLDLLVLCVATCAIGCAVHGYVLHLNFQRQESDSWTSDSLSAFFQSLPIRLALTTSGSRLDCTDEACRRANTLTAAVDVLCTLLLLLYLPRRLRRHVEKVARRVDHARVTAGDYSIELTGLPPAVTEEEVQQLLRRTLTEHASARLRELEAREARAMQRMRAGKIVTYAVEVEVELAARALAQCRRFLHEERWRVADGGVVLCLRNGALLQRAQRKVPLLKKIERHRKMDQRIRALRGGPPRCWQLVSRARDWKRARKIAALEEELKISSSLLQADLAGAQAQRAHSAIVTFEEEEGRLEALHAFQPGGVLGCCVGGVRAHEVAEPSDLFFHNIEHRGSAANLLRTLASFGILSLVLAAAFALLFTNANLNDIVISNNTAAACDGLRRIVGSAATDDEAASGAAAAGGGGERHEVCVYLSALAARFLPVLTAPAVNQILYLVVDSLARMQRPGSFTALTYTKATYIFLFQLLNTGLIPLLVAGSTRVLEERQPDIDAGQDLLWFELGSEPYDFSLDERWYEVASSAVLLMLLALTVSSGGIPFVDFYLMRLLRRYLEPRAVTAHALRVARTGPPFAFAQRVGSAVCVLALTLTFGPAMPLAWALGTLYFGVALATQHWALLRLNRLPELAFDDSVMKRMVKWTKYVLLLHLLATYCTVRTLPCLSLREVHADLVAGWIRSSRWLRPLVAQQGPWIAAAAFSAAPSAPPAPPAGAGVAAADAPDAVSLGSVLALAIAAGALATILFVCVCSGPVKLCARRRRQLNSLTADKHFVNVRRGRHDLAKLRDMYKKKLDLSTELGELQGLPPFSAALVGAEHPALRRLPDGTFVHLSEVVWSRPCLPCCGAGGVPWDKWIDGAFAAAHTTGVRSYRPADHPKYRDACQVILAAERTTSDRRTDLGPAVDRWTGGRRAGTSTGGPASGGRERANTPCTPSPISGSPVNSPGRRLSSGGRRPSEDYSRISNEPSLVADVV